MYNKVLYVMRDYMNMTILTHLRHSSNLVSNKYSLQPCVTKIIKEHAVTFFFATKKKPFDHSNKMF